MGFTTDTSARGNFYLVTHPNFFQSSLGDEGLEERKMVIIFNDEARDSNEEMSLFSIDFGYDHVEEAPLEVF
jgi:hypothetical protein